MKAIILSLFMAVSVLAAEKSKGPKLTFTYNMVNDVEATKEFYGKVLGLKVGSYTKGSYVGINIGEIELLFFKTLKEVPKLKGWAWQPGDSIQTDEEVDSLSIAYSALEFAKLFKRIKENKVETKSKLPQWRQKSYWAMTVKDPLGKTIELYTVPKIKPKQDNPVWK